MYESRENINNSHVVLTSLFDSNNCVIPTKAGARDVIGSQMLAFHHFLCSDVVIFIQGPHTGFLCTHWEVSRNICVFVEVVFSYELLRALGV